MKLYSSRLNIYLISFSMIYFRLVRNTFMTFKACFFLQIILKTIKKNYYNDNISLCVYEFIQKFASDTAKTQRTVKKVVSYLPKQVYLEATYFYVLLFARFFLLLACQFFVRFSLLFVRYLFRFSHCSLLSACCLLRFAYYSFMILSLSRKNKLPYFFFLFIFFVIKGTFSG